MSYLSVENRMHEKIVGLLGVALLASVGIAQSANAQATSMATPAVVCDVAPRSVDEMLAQLTTLPEDGGAPLSPTPLPAGQPADAATEAKITRVVRQLESCINAGDQLRVYALFSEDLFRQPLNEELVADLEAELTNLASATPQPVPPGQRQILIGPWHVETLEDGRVVAAVRFRFEDETRYPSSTKALIFVRQHGQWLIEEMVDQLWTSDGLVAVADVVGPPPGE